MRRKLQMVSEMVSSLSGVEVRLVSVEDDSLDTLIRDSFYGSVLSLIPERGIRGYLAELKPERLYLLSGFLGLSYAVIRLREGERYLVAGPCQPEDFSESRVRNSLRTYKLSDQMLLHILGYCSWQPVLNQEKLHQLGMLLARHVLELPEPIPYEYLTFHWSVSDHAALLAPERYEDQSQIRRIELRYEISAAMTEAVKQGNLALALRLLQSMPQGLSVMVRNPDPVRNAQNYCIIMNTQFRHAMEECGIHPYRLDKVSGALAARIEKLKTLDEVAKFYIHIIRRYCDLALEERYAHLDHFSRQAVVYIKNHLTDNLTVKNTAKALLVNANYLSGKFHQALGMTFTDFVNKQRTEQAAALLKHTNMQIQQIAATVGYNNASYFAKQFLRFQGRTPRDYRRGLTAQAPE